MMKAYLSLLLTVTFIAGISVALADDDCPGPACPKPKPDYPISGSMPTDSNDLKGKNGVVDSNDLKKHDSEYLRSVEGKETPPTINYKAPDVQQFQVDKGGIDNTNREINRR